MRIFVLGLFSIAITNAALAQDWSEISFHNQMTKSIGPSTQATKSSQGPITTDSSPPAVQMPTEIDYIRQIGLAASQGNADAQIRLGAISRGNKNEIEATKWFTAAAEQGHPKAQLFLGYRYLYGVGAPQNLELADHWLRKAADQGERVAQDELLRQSSNQIKQAFGNSLKVIGEDASIK